MRPRVYPVDVERLVPLLPIAFGAMLIAGWMLWRRNDPEMQASWRPIALLVGRQITLFAVIGIVLIYPRLLPVVVTGVLAALVIWWWARSRPRRS